MTRVPASVLVVVGLALKNVTRLVVGLAWLAGASFASAQTLAGGQFHSVILTSSGTVWTVGSNSDGQLGDNTLTTRKVPIVVSGLNNVTAVAAGYNHTLALKSDGTLWTWGDNQYGQLGDGSTTDRKLPVQITTLSNVIAIAAGQYHSVAVTASGQVYTWGRNFNGQLGTGNNNNASSPVQILSSGGASVGAGQTHTLVVKMDGTVWATGLNGNGQLGNGNTNQQLSLVQMTGVSGASRAGGGAQFSVVLLANGTAVATGYNGSGQIGDNTSTQRTTAVAVVGLTGATTIAVDENHTLARTSSGEVYAWGANGSGRLGDGTTTLRQVPTLVSALPAVQDVAAGSAHSLAVTADGTVWAWGSNSSSQLGDGTTANRFVPDTMAGASYTWRVATPTLSPGTGTYNADRSVVVTTETTGSTIHYTRNGDEPTEADSIVASGSTVTVGETQTLKVKAWKIGMLASITTSATYTMKVAQPSFSPGFGTFTSPTNVTITSSTPGTTIRYTLDGSVPSETSTLYTGPIAIATTTPLTAIATKTNWSTSDPRGPSTYTMNFGTLAAPTIETAAGTYEGQVSVTLSISSAPSGAIIRYTTNGTTPLASSTAYDGPVPITKTSTLRAKVFHQNYTTSPEASATYAIKVPTPVLSLAPGSYQPGAQVTLTSPDTGATLHVTFTGTDPTSTDGSVPTGTALLVGSFTMKVRATKDECVDSDVAVATYTLTEPLGPGALVAGAEHTVFATPQGLLYAWGRNNFGQIGDGSTTPTTPRTAPTPIPSLTGVISLAAGDSHTLALTWDGRVFAWGSNNSGRLGDGTTTDHNRPVVVPSLSDVVAIAAGGSHSLALTRSGSVYAWGVGTSGQLGQGTTASLSVPTLVPGLTGIVSIAGGEWHSLALTSTGRVYAWGANGSGQLGDGTTQPKTSPVLLSGLTQVAAVRAGGIHNLARLQNGNVYAWGGGSQGQLGLGGGTNVSTPALVSGYTALDLDAGDLHSLGIGNDGALSAWGDNANGKLGDGTTTDKLSPLALASPTSVAFIAAGDNHSIAVTTTGHVWSWGANTYGQLGDGTTTGQLSSHEVMTVAGTWGATPTPTLSLAPGTYDTPQAVTVTAGAGITVRYTTTGSAPTEVDPILSPEDIVAIDHTMVLSVKAWSATRAPSAVVVANYQLQPPAPTATVAAGVYNAAQTVSLQSVPDTDIRYTLDGSEPTETSPLYSAALTISQSAVVRARAFRSNWTPSNVLDAGYQIVVPVTTVSLAAPSNAAVFDAPATVDIQAAVTTNALIAAVHFYEGTTSLGTISTPPYRIAWSAPGPGVYTLSASAVDQFGTMTTASSKMITVRSLPVISDVSPSSAVAGTLVTVTGTNFGSTQGTSSLWLGTKVGLIETWTDGIITARIAGGASSGTAQVRLSDRKSNTVALTVLTPVISNATPGSGVAGSAVTITGSNFGTAQGTGQIWLGTAPGIVTSWGDGQIVATIASGSQTGTVQVLQYGVASNSVPLTIGGVSAPQISWLSPNQGGSGTVVTLYGTGFGASQSSGSVRLGNTLAEVTSWSDTQVLVTVPTNAVSGVVKLQRGGVWSNAVSFRVPAPPASASVVSPNALSLVVGETRTLQALDDNGAPITGATWASSDTDVVSLSSADPPVLTAIAPGTVTVTVGSASAEVTVYAGPTLPLGTVVWTNGASTEGGLYPAVPNYDAVADVFAVGSNHEVTAITADGSTAWTYQGASSSFWLFPDFQGGAVLYDYNEVLTRLDPLTGAPLQLFSYTSPHAQQFGYSEPRIHPEGTVFTTDYACTSADCTGGTDAETRAWVVGVDNKTAATKFRVPLQNWTDTTTITPADQVFCQASGDAWTGHAWPESWSAIVAGDGRYYVSYTTKNWTGTVQRSPANLYADAAYNLWDQLVAHVVNTELTAARTKHAQLRAATGESYTSWDSQLDDYLDSGDRTSAISLLNQQNLKYKRLCDSTFSSVMALRVMQVSADGSSSDVVVKTWETTDATTYIRSSGPEAPWGYREAVALTGPKSISLEGMNFISDQDQGALASWVAIVQCSLGAPGALVLVNTCVAGTDHHLTSLRNGVLSSDVVRDQTGSHAVRLDLQLEDGSFVGVQSDASYTNTTMMAFNATGATKWTLPGYEPQQTVAGGGLVANGTEFDAQGAAVRPVAALPSYSSWSQDAYSATTGVVEAVELPGVTWGTGFASMQAGNPSTFGTSIGVTVDYNAIPQYKKIDWGAQCQLAPPGVLGKEPLSNDVIANIRYLLAKEALLASGSPFNSNACTQSLSGLQTPINKTDLANLINRLNPYNALLSTISQYDAGMILPRQIGDLVAEITLKGAPVCEKLLIRTRRNRTSVDETTVAIAQVFEWSGLPPSDIYINAYPGVATAFLTQGTIVHEALHTLTRLPHPTNGINEPTLDALLGPPSNGFPKAYPQEGDVTRRIRELGCAGN